VNLKQLIILGLAFLGLILVYVDKTIGIGNYDFIGIILALISAIVYAIIVFMFNTEIKKYDKNQLVFYQNIFSAIFFIPFLVDLPKVHIEHLGLAIVNGFLIGVVVFKLFFFGLKHLHPITVSSLMYLEVVSSIVLGYFIFNEYLGWHTLLGGSLIILSGFLLSLGKSSQV
jgi:drug/metabolite transporter (DMT)-like permease